jgi:Tol biopolymer transport system component
MKRWLLLGLVVAGGVAAFILLRGPDPLTFADPDCSDDVPVMAFNLSGGLRQDDVAVVERNGKVNRLTRDHASFGAEFSPDGRQIVFTSGREGSHEECCGYLDQEIYIMASDGGRQRRLMPDGDHFDGHPVWAPDGEEIAFWRRGQGIMAVAPEEGEPEIVHSEPVDVHDIDWSPDGKRLAFAVHGSIYTFERGAGSVEVGAEAVGGVDEISWSPDGDRLAFSVLEKVFTTAVDDPDPRPLAHDGHSPAWSGDGNYLAYFRSDGGFEPRLVAQPAGGGKEIPLNIRKKDLYSFATDLDWLDCN